MDDLKTLIKIEMIKKGREDFTQYLAEILGCSKQWASVKLTGKSDFTAEEIVKINRELDFDAEKLKLSLS